MSIVVLGYGAVGRATVLELVKAGLDAVVAQRKRPTDLPEDVAFRACDVLDAASVAQAVKGAEQVVLAVGLPYSGKLWQEAWPKVMRNVLAACAAEKARLLFFDNLYMYGPQDKPLSEDMPLTSMPRKPAVRAEVTRMWMAAAKAGAVRVAALRAPDFFGPGVAATSMLGTTGFQALAQGKKATLVVPPDMPHDFAYVPDIGRAVLCLLQADDGHFNQAWHMPCAPIHSVREILAMGAKAEGLALRMRVLSPGMIRAIGVFVPLFRELLEMRFQWDRPYRVDASKFLKAFEFVVTPMEQAAAETLRSFRAKA